MLLMIHRALERDGEGEALYQKCSLSGNRLKQYHLEHTRLMQRISTPGITLEELNALSPIKSKYCNLCETASDITRRQDELRRQAVNMYQTKVRNAIYDYANLLRELTLHHGGKRLILVLGGSGTDSRKSSRGGGSKSRRGANRGCPTSFVMDELSKYFFVIFLDEYRVSAPSSCNIYFKLAHLLRHDLFSDLCSRDDHFPLHLFCPSHPPIHEIMMLQLFNIFFFACSVHARYFYFIFTVLFSFHFGCLLSGLLFTKRLLNVEIV